MFEQEDLFTSEVDMHWIMILSVQNKVQQSITKS